MALLDVQKAFDTVWHKGLFLKLYQAGVKDRAWLFLLKWYNQSSCSVLWCGKSSRVFTINQGVKQGGILSPFLYSLFVNDLLKELAVSGYGVSVDDLFTGAPMYADDLALISSSSADLQNLLEIVFHYSRRWKYQLNVSKTKILVFGSRIPPAPQWSLGDGLVTVESEHFHLGVLRSVTNSMSRTLHHLSNGRSSFFALYKYGARFGCLHPVSALKLYTTFLSSPFTIWLRAVGYL